MVTSKENVETERQSRRSVWLRAMDILGYPLAGIMGSKAATTLIRSSIYKNVARSGAFDEYQKAHKEKIFALMSNPLKTGLSAPAELSEYNETYRNKIKGLFADKGMKNVGDFWKGLTENQKIEAITTGFTVASIALGAIILVTNQLEHFQNKIRTEREQARDSNTLESKVRS